MFVEFAGGEDRRAADAVLEHNIDCGGGEGVENIYRIQEKILIL